MAGLAARPPGGGYWLRRAALRHIDLKHPRLERRRIELDPIRRPLPTIAQQLTHLVAAVRHRIAFDLAVRACRAMTRPA